MYLIQCIYLGSADEKNGVWTGPELNVYFTHLYSFVGKAECLRGKKGQWHHQNYGIEKR